MGASLGAGVGLVDGLLDTGAAEGAQEISSTGGHVTGGHVTGGQVTGGQLMVGTEVISTTSMLSVSFSSIIARRPLSSVYTPEILPVLLTFGAGKAVPSTEKSITMSTDSPTSTPGTSHSTFWGSAFWTRDPLVAETLVT
jgi:hypothetical protein